DVPCEGTVVDTRRQLVVGGWVYGHDEPVTVVEVHLEDQLLGRVVADGSRPDVAAALGTSGAERSGFNLCAPLPPSRAVHGLLRVTACLADGSRHELERVRVSFRPFVDGRIDEPEPGAALDPSGFRVRGWAYAPVVPVARVDVFLDGQSLGRAGLGRPRPDVARSRGAPDAELS